MNTNIETIAVCLFLAVFVNGYFIAAGPRYGRAIINLCLAVVATAAAFILSFRMLDQIYQANRAGDAGFSITDSPLLWLAFALIVILLLLIPINNALYYRRISKPRTLPFSGTRPRNNHAEYRPPLRTAQAVSHQRPRY